MKNICIFVNSLLSGGAEKQALILSKLLKEKYNVWLVVYYGDRTTQKNLDFVFNNDIQIFRLRGNHLSKSISFFQFLNKNSIDIIFSYLLTTNLIGGLVGRVSKAKYCIGGIRNSELKFGKVVLNKILHNYVNKCTIYNNFSGYEYYTKRGFNKEKAIVIPNCIDDIPSSINRDQKQYINVLSVGRFHHQKDFLTSLKSVKKITSKSLPIKYTIIGYGELEKQIKKWVLDLNMEKYVKIILNPDDIKQYYKEADIFLSTSLYEGLPNTLLEAMSYSLPVVATDVGDNRRLIENGINGFLCEVKNYMQISKKINFLIQNKDNRIQFGLKNYQIINENFSPDNFKNKYLKLIKSLN